MVVVFACCVLHRRMYIIRYVENERVKSWLGKKEIDDEKRKEERERENSMNELDLFLDRVPRISVLVEKVLVDRSLKFESEMLLNSVERLWEPYKKDRCECSRSTSKTEEKRV